MRLTDRCQILNGTAPVGGPIRCEFGHTGGDVAIRETSRVTVEMFARVIIGPDRGLLNSMRPQTWNVDHDGIRYQIRAILPRYRPGGRLHHISIELKRREG